MGTENIIQACLDCNVERLIFCSTVDVVIGHDDINDGDETTPIPTSFLFPGYPESKYKAECLILNASGRKCKNGNACIIFSVPTIIKINSF
jgi:nucleoside-diphosphate-sugar epimerase